MDRTSVFTLICGFFMYLVNMALHIKLERPDCKKDGRKTHK